MKSIFTIICLFLANLAFSQNLNLYTVGQELQEAVADDPDGWHEVLIFYADRIDTRAMNADFYARKLTMQQRMEELIPTLQNKANSTQATYLQAFEDSDQVRNVQSFWITNFIYAEVKAEYLANLSHDSAIESIELNMDLTPADYKVSAAPMPPAPNNSEPGLRAIDADTMWAMGYTGYGSIGFVVDTGTDMLHPALMSNFHGNNAPVNQAWFAGNFSDYPEDCDSHGTHVTGTMAGLDRSTNDTIGVAFNAHWTSSPPITCANGLVSAVGGFQWALNPDNNASTTEDMPDAINNSWGIPDFSNCNSGLTSIMNTMEATKIAVVFAAGNNGPGVGTVFNPANINTDLVNTFTVGAVEYSSNHNIAGFSSRGPSNCTGQGSLEIKPEVSAPGVNIRSTFPNGTYSSIQGTSMASPHVAGAILLLREAFPETTGADLKMALYMSATDLGEEGEDNVYGMGIINVPAAFDYLIEQGFTPTPPVSKERDVIATYLEIPDLSCSDNFMFNLYFENNGVETLTSLTIDYTISSIQETFQWTGSLAPGEITNVTFSPSVPAGNHEMRATLSAPNGLLDDRPLNNSIFRPFVINDDTPIEVYAEGEASAYCTDSEVLLRADYQGLGDISTKWFETLTGGTSLGSGNVFNIGALDESQTFYAESNLLLPVGKTSLGTETSFPSVEEPGLRFDALADFKLKSVLVYFDEPGVRFIQAENASGTVVHGTKIANIIGESPQRVTLNFNIPQGGNHRLKLMDSEPLLMDTEGVDFPYEIDDIVRLERSLASNSTQGSSQYHCFYDWIIELPHPCGRVAVEVDVIAGEDSPTADFATSATEVNIAIDGNVDFVNNSENATSFLWNFGDGTTDETNESTSHTYTESGTYIVSLTVFNADGCSNSLTTEVVVINESPSSNNNIIVPDWNINLFPNPTADELLVDFSLKEPSEIAYRMVDLYGRTILSSTQKTYSNTQIALDVSSVSAGVYYFIFENETERMVRKVVKM